jgi:glutaredoxin-related protein
MLSLEQMQEIAKTQNVIFFKKNCPICNASIILFDRLVKDKIIEIYSVFVLDVDFRNSTLGELAFSSGWSATGGEAYPSKPQIYIEGEYIGGNWELYRSKWNTSGPNLKNPMRF